VTINSAEFTLLVRRCLSHGVPTGIVAEVFALTEELVKKAKAEILTAEYGTADQAEYLDWLQWKTLERCAWIMEHGSAAEVTKIATSVLGRQIASAGKRTSDVQREAVERLSASMERMRTGTVESEVAPSRFVVQGGEDDG
jgi:hypothetical protein